MSDEKIDSNVTSSDKKESSVAQESQENKRVLKKQSKISSDSFINKNREKILLGTIIICFLSTAIPLAIAHYMMELYLTAGEAYIAFTFFFTSCVAFLIALYTVLKKKTLFYPMLYLIFHFIIGLLFTAVNFTVNIESIFVFVVWIIYDIIVIVGIIAAKRTISKERRFLPHINNRRFAVCSVLAIIALLLPLSTYFVGSPYQEYEIGVLHDEQQNLEINFTLANLTRSSQELLDILEEANNLEHINISLTAGFLEEFVLNTTLLIGEEFVTQGEYIGPLENYDSYADYKKDVDEYERYWNNFTKKARTAVEELSYEELLTNDSLYLMDCLVLDELLAYDSIGIAVDLMPLIEREVYINDYTIDRFNKTSTIMKRWIKLTGAPHRGIIIDTERMWGQDDETLMDYFDRENHREGIVKLGEAILDLKLFQWEIKGLEAEHGEFSKDKWDKYAVQERVTMIAGATFGLHVHDLWDKDDAQQNLFKISILAEENPNDPTIAQLDMIGIMTYENAENSEHAVYGYCRAGDYFFGNRSIPYIYSGLENSENYIGREKEYMEGLYRKFKVAQNYGYDAVGMWGLTNIYCFTDIPESWDDGCGGVCAGRWCGGMYDFLSQTGNAQLMMDEIFQKLEDNWQENITVTYDKANYAMVTYAISVLDLYLTADRVYNEWPINAQYVSRIRPDEFQEHPILDEFLRAIMIIAFLYFAVKMYDKSIKAKEEELEKKAGLNKGLSAFFLFTGLNFFFNELNLRYFIFPKIFAEDGTYLLTTPQDSDLFMILFILLSAIPMMFALEKYLMDRKRFIITYLASICLGGIVLIVFWNEPSGSNASLNVFTNIFVIYGFVMMVLCGFRLGFIYIWLAYKGSGSIRTLGLLMGIGFVLLIAGIVLTSMIPSAIWIFTPEAIGHFISLVGVILIYLGINKLQ